MITQFHLSPSLGVECGCVQTTFLMRVRGLTLRYMGAVIIAHDKGTDLLKKINVK